VGVENGPVKLNLNHGVYASDPNLEKWSSLLDPVCLGYDRFNCFRGPSIEVPCIRLDDWCLEYGVDHIDFLYLDVEGFELQILQNCSRILETVLVVHTKTNLTGFRKNTTLYGDLRDFLERSGFVLMSHWYLDGLQGEATFIRSKLYNAVFR
jgi:hypothetical protein